MPQNPKFFEKNREIKMSQKIHASKIFCIKTEVSLVSKVKIMKTNLSFALKVASCIQILSKVAGCKVHKKTKSK